MLSFKSFALLALPLIAQAAPSSFVPAVDPSRHLHSCDTASATPQGKNETVNGVLTYVTLPKGGFEKDTAVLLLTDVFGLPSVDNLLLADEWAAAGFATYAPDYLNGDAIAPDGDINAWLPNHGEAQTTPPLLAVVNELKSRGVKKLAVTGYCFGGLYTTRLAQNNTVTVGTMSHPSLLTVPEDFELVLAQSHVPIEINNAELDTALTPALAQEVDDVLGDGKYAPGYSRRQFAGVGHGFAVSANASDPVAVAAKKGAFDTSLAFIKAHLN